MAEFAYQDLLPLSEDVTPYRLLTRDGVSPLAAGGRTFLEVDTAALTLLGREAMRDRNACVAAGRAGLPSGRLQ
jgi:fumarate hydratase class I